MKNILFEIKKFFKKHFLKTLLLSLLLGIIFVVLSIFLNRGNVVEEIEETDESIYDSGDAIVSIYVEEQDGDQFSNTAIIEQYIRTEESIQNIAEETNTDIDVLVEEDIKTSQITGNTDERVITTNRNQYSGLMEIIISTDDPEKNMVVAKYILDNLQNDIPFLEDKTIYEVGNNPRMIEESDVFVEAEELQGSSFSLIIRFLSGFILSFIIIMIALFIYEYFARKITFMYSIQREPDEEYLLISNDGFNQHLLNPFVNSTNDANQYAIFESGLNCNLPSEINNLHLVDDINQLPNKENMEIIVIICSGMTNRKWYKNVKEYLDYTKSKVKIIQIN